MNLDVHNPKLMFIIGCIGLGLNIISAVFLHGTVNGVVVKYHANSPEHGHGHGHEHSHDHSPSPTIETPVLHLGEECHDSSTKVSRNNWKNAINGEQLTQLSITITNIFISKNITAKTQAAIAMVMAVTTTVIWV